MSAKKQNKKKKNKEILTTQEYFERNSGETTQQLFSRQADNARKNQVQVTHKCLSVSVQNKTAPKRQLL